MDCLIARPDVQEIAERLKTELSLRVFNGAKIAAGSNEDIIAYVLAGQFFELSGYAAQLAMETNPLTMCCENLISYADLRGQSRRAATRSTGYIKLSGTVGAFIPSDIKFTSTNGNEYKLDPRETNPSLLTENTLFKIVSVETGTKTNITLGTQIGTNSVVPGINMIATAVTDIGGAADDESCEELRARLLEKLRSGAVVTNVEWYKNKLMEWAGVTRVCVSGCDSCCTGKGITLYPFMEQLYHPFGTPPLNVLESMEDWMFGKPKGVGYGQAPVGSDGSINCAQPCAITVTIKGAGNISSSQAEEVMQRFSSVLKEKICVGGEVCKKWFDEILISSVGGSCYTSIDFAFGDCALDRGSVIKLKCGHFPYIGGVIFAQ